MALTELQATTAKRSVFAIHMSVLARGETLSVAARKMHIVLARMAGEQYRRLSEAQRTEIETALRDYVANFRDGKLPDKPVMLLQPRFFANMRELAEMVGHDPKAARNLAAHFTRLQNCSVRFNSLSQRSKVSEEHDLFPDELEVTAKLLSSVVRNGRGQVSWAYDPLILGIMVNPRTYTYLSLELIKNARTYTALALYENCRRFVDIKKTGAYPVRQWQELLSHDGVVPAWETSAEFLRKVKSAIAELDACEGCDILISPERVQVPNVGSCLQFSVAKREQSRLPFGLPVPTNRDLHLQLTDAGFTDDEAVNYCDTHGEEYLITKFAILAKAKDVRDPKAWLRSAIEKDFKDAVVSLELERQKTRQKAEKARKTETVKAAFESFRADRLRQRFGELDEAQRVTWELRFAESGDAEKLQAFRGSARQQLFYAWLAKQSHDLFMDPEELDFAAFAIGYLDNLPQPKALA